MNDSTGVTRQPQLAWPAAARAAAAVTAMAALVLLTPACGVSPSSPGSGSTNPGGSTNSQKALAFADCMRAQGVERYPDPSSTNDTPSGLPKVSFQQLEVSSTQFDAAETACAHLLPAGTQPTQAASEQILSKLLNFADCMRNHGVQNWPDPIPVSTQAPPGAPPYTFDLDGLQGLDERSFSPPIATAMNECFTLTRLTDAEVPWSG